MNEERDIVPFDVDFDSVDGGEKEKQQGNGALAQMPPRVAFYLGLAITLTLVSVSGFFVLLSLVIN